MREYTGGRRKTDTRKAKDVHFLICIQTIIVGGRHITVYLSEEEMWGLIKQCVQYEAECNRRPLGHRECYFTFCEKILNAISPTAAKAIGHNYFKLNKDGSIPKRIEKAFKKVQAVLLAGKKVARRPKEKP